MSRRLPLRPEELAAALYALGAFALRGLGLPPQRAAKIAAAEAAGIFRGEVT